MRNFLFNKVNLIVLTVWGMAAASFNLWQLALGGHVSGLGLLAVLIPSSLLGLRSYFVLMSISQR